MNLSAVTSFVSLLETLLALIESPQSQALINQVSDQSSAIKTMHGDSSVAHPDVLAKVQQVSQAIQDNAAKSSEPSSAEQTLISDAEKLAAEEAAKKQQQQPPPTNSTNPTNSTPLSEIPPIPPMAQQDQNQSKQ